MAAILANIFHFQTAKSIGSSQGDVLKKILIEGSIMKHIRFKEQILNILTQNKVASSIFGPFFIPFQILDVFSLSFGKLQVWPRSAVAASKFYGATFPSTLGYLASPFFCSQQRGQRGARTGAEAGGFSRHGQWPAEACRRVGDAQMLWIDLYRSNKKVT